MLYLHRHIRMLMCTPKNEILIHPANVVSHKFSSPIEAVVPADRLEQYMDFYNSFDTVQCSGTQAGGDSTG